MQVVKNKKVVYHHLPSSLEEYVLAGMFKNGSASWMFAEHWAQKFLWQIGRNNYSFERNEKQTKGFDGYLVCKNKKYKTGVRTLTKCGIKFQSSKNQGKNRTCDHQDQLDALSDLQYYIVCDITLDDRWIYSLVPINLLVNEIENGSLGKNGWKTHAFYSFLGENGYHFE